MAHLYELTDAYKQLLETEELTEEELIVCLNNITDLFQEKAGNIGKLVLSLQADTVIIESEIKRLSERKQAVENRSKSLKSYLTQEMEATNMDKIKNELLTISLQKNPPSVFVFSEDIVPSQYWRIIPERKEIDKQTILSVYKEHGNAIPGVEIITDKKHVVIR